MMKRSRERRRIRALRRSAGAGRGEGDGVSDERKAVLDNGITVETKIPHEKLWARAIEHYSHRVNWWECPWCGGEIDAVDMETDDDETWDTWSCVGNCNLLITFITPAEYTEYHDVPDGDWRVLIESGHNDATWYAPEEADDEVADDTEET